MVNNFNFQVTIPQSIIGLGSVKEICNVISSLGKSNILLISDVGIKKAKLLEKVAALLQKEKINHTIFDECEPNAPLDIIYKWVRQFGV